MEIVVRLLAVVAGDDAGLVRRRRHASTDQTRPTGRNTRSRATRLTRVAYVFSTLTPEGMGRLVQGSLEGSNVEIVQEMVEMITTLRTYESSQRVITSIDGTLDKAVNAELPAGVELVGECPQVIG